GLLWPRRWRRSAANRPNSISRVLSGCKTRPNVCNRSRRLLQYAAAGAGLLPTLARSRLSLENERAAVGKARVVRVAGIGAPVPALEHVHVFVPAVRELFPDREPAPRVRAVHLMAGRLSVLELARERKVDRLGAGTRVVCENDLVTAVAQRPRHP